MIRARGLRNRGPQVSVRGAAPGAALSALFGAIEAARRERAELVEKLGAAQNSLAGLEIQLAAALPAEGNARSALGGGGSAVGARYRSLVPRRSPASHGRRMGDPAAAVTPEERRLVTETRPSPAGDGDPALQPDVDSLLARIDEVCGEIESCRAALARLEQRIETLEEWTFEALGESLPEALVPAIRRVLERGSSESETFRLLSTKMAALRDEKNLCCVGFVSGAAEEGKTTTVLGLALTMAKDPNTRVLLIEAELRKPSLERLLGLPPRAGLSDWLKGTAGPVRLRHLEPSGLYLLGGGTPVRHPAELIGSGRMAQLIRASREMFDYVLVDCPPPVSRVDSILLQEMVDGFLVVVRARHTPREMIESALGHLRADRIHGMIFNDHSEILPRFYSRGRER